MTYSILGGLLADGRLSEMKIQDLHQGIDTESLCYHLSLEFYPIPSHSKRPIMASEPAQPDRTMIPSRHVLPKEYTFPDPEPAPTL